VLNYSVIGMEKYIFVRKDKESNQQIQSWITLKFH